MEFWVEFVKVDLDLPEAARALSTDRNRLHIAELNRLRTSNEAEPSDGHGLHDSLGGG